MKTLYPCLLLLLLFGLSSCSRNFGLSVTATPFPINGKLAFCGKEKNDERFDIYLLDLSTGKFRNLTKKYAVEENIDDTFGHSIGCDNDMIPYRVTGLAWSPAGDLILVNAGEPYFSTPYILQISENGDLLRLVQQWPGGRYNVHIYEYPLQYSWSPNGNTVAFVGLTASDGYSNLFIGDVSDWINSNPNTPVEQITDEYRDFPGVIYTPSWSPNGEKIAVSLNGHASGIIIISSDGERSVSITNDTSKVISQVKHPYPWNDFPAWKPSWFPDNSSVVFVGAISPGDRSTLFKVDQDGNNLTVLVSKGVNNPVVSPDGRSIAYIETPSSLQFSTVGRIVRVDAQGHNRQVLATFRLNKAKMFWERYYIRDLSWSPDGEWLVFTSNVSGKFQLYLVAADGSGVEQIMAFPGDAVFPQWRPNIFP